MKNVKFAKSKQSPANLGFETKLWAVADKLRRKGESNAQGSIAQALCPPLSK